jgi:ankyrin repeat protein
MKKILYWLLLITAIGNYELYAESNMLENLWLASANGNVEDIKRFSSPESINSVNELGYSSLIIAAVHDNFPVFEWLVNNGADLSIKTKLGLPLQIILGYFSNGNFLKACNLLHDKGIDLDSPEKNNFSLIHYLVFAGDIEKVKILLEFKPDLNRKENISGAIPIDLIQYSTYEYTDADPILDETRQRSYDLREILIKAGSRDIEYAPLTMSNYGAFFFVNFKILKTIKPEIPIQNVNKMKYYTFLKQDEQQIARLDLKNLQMMYADNGIKVNIKSYNSGFERVIDECEK